MAVKEVHGPGPRGARGPRPKVENPGKLLKRIMDEVFRNYLPHCILVLVCIVVSALANVQASLFLKTLMDDYIVPMTQQQDPDFAPLAAALLRVGIIYVIGILAAWGNARIMVNVTQGTLRNLRTQLFTHMESLPIKYFDQHPHGDIMSVYTNDVDTLRQMLSQSIPQLVSSAITIVSVFFSMCMLSWQLTIVTMLMVALMMFCSKKITQQDDRNDDPAAAAAAKAGILITHIVTSYENLTAVRSHSHSMPPQEKCSSGLGDTIAECQQGVHKVDVLEENAVLLGGQLHVGEVPEASDAQTDQPVGQRLRHALRHGQHRHVGMVAGHVVLQLVHGVDGHAADLRPDQRGGDVEGGVDAEAYLFKVEVLQQRMTQMPHADDDDAVPAVDAENVADLRPQLRHVVAVALLPELTEAAEILPDLGGGDVHFSAQRIGADAHHALVVQVV